MSASEASVAGQETADSHQDSRLRRLIHGFATPLTSGLFVVSAISGVALFFRWQPSIFHTMHVWLSMVLLLPFVVHVWKNWRSLLGYAKRGTLAMPLAASLVAALLFAYFGMTGGRRGNPALRAIPLMTQARLSELAPILKTTPEGLLATLKQRGYQARSIDETLDAVAGASGKQSSEVLFAVMPAR
jgi:hypothetical protein